MKNRNIYQKFRKFCLGFHFVVFLILSVYVIGVVAAPKVDVQYIIAIIVETISSLKSYDSSDLEHFANFK